MSVEMRERLSYLGYRGGWSAVRHLPEGAAYRAFRGIADVAWRKRGPGVRRLEANLSRAIGTEDEDALREVSHAGMRSYLRYWCDTFRLPDWSNERIVSRVRAIGEEPFRKALAEGRGVIMVLPHMGNWDHGGAWACLTGAQVTTVAERLRPEALYERFLSFRRGLGMEILPLTGGADDVFGTLSTRLSDGGLVPLLADRDLSRRGIDVTLLGEATRMPPGPAALAMRTGAALVPVTLYYEGAEPDHHAVLHFHPEVDPDTGGARGAARVALLTQRVADVFTEGIAAHPEDWHMLQRMFLDDLADSDPRREKVAR
jgi:KDO2-lipid IV(A) lauroyltransferase